MRRGRSVHAYDGAGGAPSTSNAKSSTKHHHQSSPGSYERIRGWADSWKCPVACRPGELSQQPTWPHARQSRRWTHRPPCARHSSQPAGVSGSGAASTPSRCEHASVISATLTPFGTPWSSVAVCTTRCGCTAPLDETPVGASRREPDPTRDRRHAAPPGAASSATAASQRRTARVDDPPRHRRGRGGVRAPQTPPPLTFPRAARRLPTPSAARAASGPAIARSST